MKKIINQKLLDRITRKTNKLATKWEYPEDIKWQLWQMVATVMVGAKSTRFEGDGIVVAGWNDGGFFNPNPKSAWGGFYRLEPNQMVGWSLHLIDMASAKLPQVDRCNRAYGLNLVWGE